MTHTAYLYEPRSTFAATPMDMERDSALGVPQRACTGSKRSTISYWTSIGKRWLTSKRLACPKATEKDSKVTSWRVGVCCECHLDNWPHGNLWSIVAIPSSFLTERAGVCPTLMFFVHPFLPVGSGPRKKRNDKICPVVMNSFLKPTRETNTYS